MSLAATVAWIVPGVGVRRVPVVVGFVMGVVVPVRATAAEMRVGRVALGTTEDRAIGNVVIVPGDGIRRVPVVVGIVMGVVVPVRATAAEMAHMPIARALTALGEAVPRRVTRATTNTANGMTLAPVETEERGAGNRALTRVEGADKAADHDTVATEEGASHGMRSLEVAGSRRDRAGRITAASVDRAAAGRNATVGIVHLSGEFSDIASATHIEIGIELKPVGGQAKAQWARTGGAIWWVRLSIYQSG